MCLEVLFKSRNSRDRANVCRYWFHLLPFVTKYCGLYGFNSSTHCCHMGTAIKHPVPDRIKPSFVIFDIRELWR